ncbi:MAG: hypothetical protein A3E01_02910 [Gammaproteobacteria bacterium RIFCSPHIGHO2_12_FULL_63_22]|nr:MAG: hypothetical protein A3E01_02910 [Gammaproteobacteria bacterium RIFCSPHIGHO2_12_FULL_63_22]
MAVDLPTEFEEDDFDNHGGTADPGWHHVQLVSADEAEDGNSCNLKFVVVSPSENAGKNCYERLWYPKGDDAEKDGTAVKKLYHYAFALRMLTREDYRAAKEDGENISLDFAQAIGVGQAVVEWKLGKERTNKSTGEKGRYPEIFFRIYDVMSEQSKNAVMSADHLTLLGITPNDAAALATPPAKAATNGNGGTAKKPSTAKSATPARQPATAAATAAAGKSAYDDI